MEIKKNPKANLENYSKIFMQIGLVLALFVTYAAIEKKTYDKTTSSLGIANMNAMMDEDIPITERVEPVKPKDTVQKVRGSTVRVRTYVRTVEYCTILSASSEAKFFSPFFSSHVKCRRDCQNSNDQ